MYDPCEEIDSGVTTYRERVHLNRWIGSILFGTIIHILYNYVMFLIEYNDSEGKWYVRPTSDKGTNKG